MNDHKILFIYKYDPFSLLLEGSKLTVCVCVCLWGVCVCVREKERKRERDRQTVDSYIDIFLNLRCDSIFTALRLFFFDECSQLGPPGAAPRGHPLIVLISSDCPTD